MRRFSFLTLLASLLIVGCTEVTIEHSNPLTEINSLPDLTASFADEGETRTFVEDSKYLRWHEADLITAFFGNTLNRQYKFKGKTGDNSGTFSLVPSGELGTGNDLSSIYAVYPYDENTTITNNGVISLTLPATQTYAENSFGKGANTMVAVTESAEDTFLSFKNACGYLKLKFYGNDVTIASIKVKGNNEEKIAGSATATMEFGGVPTIAMNDEATTSVTLDCGEGVAIGATADMATEFWIVLPETTFEGGITITATNTDGAVFSKSTTNTVVITRNDIQPMVALKTEFVAAKPANNEIWYTNGSTTESTAPLKTDVFGANIVSNTYDADKKCWVIKFDGDVLIIGSSAFYDCDSFTSITIPDSVTEIGVGAFYSCSSLTSVTIGNGITEIGEDAFYYCQKLTSVSIPDSVTEIGAGAFIGCNSLNSVHISDLSAWCRICFHSFNSKYYANPLSNGAHLYLNETLVEDLVIPNNVTSIEPFAFDNCKSIKSVTIPDSVTKIGYEAFYGCDSLTSVTIGNGITEIGDHAFHYCDSLTSVTIPDNVTEIGNCAFYRCSSLTSVTIGNGITEIGDHAFYYCQKLTSVTIPGSVTSIGSSAFYGCSSLTSVTISDGVTSIGSSAFYGCSLLTSVTIPDSVTSIGESAFSFCYMLKEVYCKSTIPPQGSTNMFVSYLEKIYVPKGCASSYKSTKYWKNYATQIEEYDFENNPI